MSVQPGQAWRGSCASHAGKHRARHELRRSPGTTRPCLWGQDQRTSMLSVAMGSGTSAPGGRERHVERLLTAAIAAFKAAYQGEPTDPTSQVHALIGAAQASCLCRTRDGCFHSWRQATPLQRAEKNLQQASLPDQTMLLPPSSSALPHRRQAAQTPGQQRDALERSQYYLTQAAACPSADISPPCSAWQDSPMALFSVEDTVVALR